MESFVLYVVGLPDELKVAIAGLVLFVVRLALAGRVPDAWLSELAAVISAALIAVIELALGLIPAEFEAVAAAILNLIVVLLGMVLVFNGYRIVKASATARGLRF